MNRIRKAKIIRRLVAELKVQENLYDQMSLDILKIDSRSKEWDDFIIKYNLCSYKISFLNKQIHILQTTGRTLGHAYEDPYTIYGVHNYAMMP